MPCREGEGTPRREGEKRDGGKGGTLREEGHSATRKGREKDGRAVVTHMHLT